MSPLFKPEQQGRMRPRSIPQRRPHVGSKVGDALSAWGPHVDQILQLIEENRKVIISTTREFEDTNRLVSSSGRTLSSCIKDIERSILDEEDIEDT